MNYSRYTYLFINVLLRIFDRQSASIPDFEIAPIVIHTIWLWCIREKGLALGAVFSSLGLLLRRAMYQCSTENLHAYGSETVRFNLISWKCYQLMFSFVLVPRPQCLAMPIYLTRSCINQQNHSHITLYTENVHHALWNCLIYVQSAPDTKCQFLFHLGHI